MSAFLNNRKINVLRAAFYMVTAFSLTACSASMDRFSDYPNVNTASLPDQAAQTSAVQQSQIDASNRPQQQAWQNAPVNQQSAYSQSQPAQQPYGRSGQVIVQSGQTLYSIARANNLTTSQLAQANNIPPPYTLRVGQVLQVPGASSPQAQIQAANQPVEPRNFSQGGMHVVRPGETLFAVGRAYSIHPYKIADYNGLSHDVALKTGQQLRIPGDPTAARAPATAARQQALSPQVKPQSVSANTNTQQLPEPPTKMAKEQMPQSQVQTQQLAADAPLSSGFRWPVRGRIISTFGAKPSGMRNEGINISVPEGTSVKAAESGIVAYAGNELKGYGNLVLIRHENGWVTAYAHNRDLFVKRGDTVKRGDIIAKAGQTGSVTSPQLHFEVRKGASAVDPLKYLGSEQAAN